MDIPGVAASIAVGCAIISLFGIAVVEWRRRNGNSDQAIHALVLRILSEDAAPIRMGQLAEVQARIEASHATRADEFLRHAS